MNKKKIITFIIMLVVTVPICIYLSTFLHNNLSGVSNNLLSLQLEEVIKSIMNNQNHLKLYLLLQILCTLFLIFIIFIQKENYYESETGYVTDSIKTPVVVGQGQHGTARWLTENEFERIFNKNI